MWNLGFAVDAVEPEGDGDATLPAAQRGMEITVGVKDQDPFSDDFIGRATFVLDPAATSKTPDVIEVDLRRPKPTDEDKDATVSAGTLLVKVGAKAMLSTVPNAGLFKDLVPLSKMNDYQWWNVETDAPPACPLPHATAAMMPKNLQGVFWLSRQGDSSALMTFAKTGDGDMCSTGVINTNKGEADYMVRCAGDRSWAFADKGRSHGAVNLMDLIYIFYFDNHENPTKCQIIPWARNVGIKLTATWIMDFDMRVVEHEKYTNSVVWLRESYLFGMHGKGEDYDLIQVVDAEGNRIEPAWSDFVAYQKDDAQGKNPGKICFRDYTPTAEGPKTGSGEE